MTLTEESRHRLHQKLDEALGPEEATTLMEHLPPVGWADVATKQDLAQLEERLTHDTALLRSDLAQAEGRLDARIDMLGVKLDGFRELFERQDRRMQGLEDRLERQLWHVIGLLGVIALIMIGAAQIWG